MATRITAPAGSVNDLTRPTLADVRTVLRHVYPDNGDRAWGSLLATTRLTGRETTPQALHHMLTTMTATTDPVLGLIAHAQTIRMLSFEHLRAAQDIIVSAP